MQTTLLLLFATLQQNRTYRRQKWGSFYVKLSTEFKGISPNFLRQVGVTKKWLKLRWSGKTRICVFWKRRVNEILQMNHFLTQREKFNWRSSNGLFRSQSPIQDTVKHLWLSFTANMLTTENVFLQNKTHHGCLTKSLICLWEYLGHCIKLIVSYFTKPMFTGIQMCI